MAGDTDFNKRDYRCEDCREEKQHIHVHVWGLEICSMHIKISMVELDNIYFIWFYIELIQM